MVQLACIRQRASLPTCELLQGSALQRAACQCTAVARPLSQ